MQAPKMLSGDWYPTPDPAGRVVRLHRQGNELQGTVIEVEISQEWSTCLYVEVTAPEEYRGEYSLQVQDAKWIDDQGNAAEPWAESVMPTGRWVMFADDDGEERSGVISAAEMPAVGRAILSVLEISPHSFRFHRVDWSEGKWLPQ